jgi:ArsR family transcriptional regulator
MNSRTAIASLAALAQESRLSIYRLLVEAGPTGLSVSEIGASLRVSPATLSFHLKELTHAGLIAARQDGRYIYYSASYARMNALLGYLTDNCCARDGVDCAPGCGPQAKSSCEPAQSRRTRRGTLKA